MSALSDITFIKRIVIGSSNPVDIQSEERIADAVALLNRCISNQSKGKIISVENSFVVLQVGEAAQNKVVLQWTTYHVGFSRRPVWLEE